MNEREAQRVAIDIENQGWHATPRFHAWTGVWTVYAWQGNSEEDEENGYDVAFWSEWFKIMRGLNEASAKAWGER